MSLNCIRKLVLRIYVRFRGRQTAFGLRGNLHNNDARMGRGNRDKLRSGPVRILK